MHEIQARRLIGALDATPIGEAKDHAEQFRARECPKSQEKHQEHHEQVLGRRMDGAAFEISGIHVCIYHNRKC